MGHGDRLARQIRTDLALPKREGGFMAWPGAIAQRYLQGCAPELEYPRSITPANLEFVGPILPPGREQGALPDWWPELVREKEDGRKVVVVTQGTVAVDPDDLIRPAIQALAGDDVSIVVTAARLDLTTVVPAGLTALDGGPVRATIRVEQFVPFDRLLPLADVLVTNGGYGGVQHALAHGVPVLTSGTSEDKRETGARVAFSGVGIALQKQRPDAGKVRDAVREILTAPQYADRARAVQASGRAGGGLQRIIEAVEGLASGTRA